MPELSRSEIDVLLRFLEDHDGRNALRVFAAIQATFYSGQCLSEMRKSQPDSLQASQHAGRVDVYEHLVNELQHFAKNQLAKS